MIKTTLLSIFDPDSTRLPLYMSVPGYPGEKKWLCIS